MQAFTFITRPSEKWGIWQLGQFSIAILISKNKIMDTEKQKQVIQEILSSFHVGIESISATEGPAATLFEIRPKVGVRISRIKNLTEEIAVGLCSDKVRFTGAIPGHGTVGFEVPNAERKLLDISEMLSCQEYTENDMALPCIIGKDINNDNLVCDLAAMPHLLIAGATGQGKSVCLNTILMSLMHRLKPEELQLVLIDPKEVEFGVYKDKLIHNFLCNPVVTEPSEAQSVLDMVATLMDKRYGLLANENVRNIAEYNAIKPKGEKLPYIVVVIDEYGDLIMQSGNYMEKVICRIAQKARAIGIHLIISTQRPSVKIVTGDIKANFPTRIAFRMITSTDSRVILGKKGAESLLGKGDMIFFNGEETARAQCAYTSTEFVKKSCDEIEGRYNGWDGHQSLYGMSGLEEAMNAAKKAEAERQAKWDLLFDKILNQMNQDQKQAYRMLETSNSTIDDLLTNADHCLEFETYEEILSHYYPHWEEVKNLR